MKQSLLIGMMVAVLLMTACAGGTSDGRPADAEGNAQPGASVEGGESERGAASYSALEPEGDAENEAVATIDQYYARYLESADLTAKENPDTVVYRDGDKVKPQFIGYRITALSDKLDNEKYNMAQVMVLDGVVTADAAWDRSGEMTIEDVNPEYFVFEVPTDYLQPMKAETARQKEAVAKAKTWLTKNFPDKQLTRFELTTLTFAYGQPTDEHHLLLDVNPAVPTTVMSSSQ